MNASARAWEVWSRPRWVIAELDVHGEIDAHAAMCLQRGIEDACASSTAMILVDLRDLVAIDAAGLRVFVQASADCRSSGAQLGLLISGHERHDAIAAVFHAAGLVDHLQFTWEPGSSPAIASRHRASAVLAARAELLRTAARRIAAAMFRRSNSA
jgi:anti-anti-sigma factor